jgi:hypothetical protein
MTRRSILLGFTAGLVAGIATMTVWVGGRSMPRASAQQVARGESQRYQIATWSYPGLQNAGNVVGQPSYGAYILDTQTGSVWVSHPGQRLESIGKVQSP